MSEIASFLESLSPRGQARVCGFLSMVAGEKAPEDLVRRGYGERADAFTDDETLLAEYQAGREAAAVLLGRGVVLSGS
jgi:hypothetical protein